MTTVNHYDILGVRTNASPQEIELAYKGRRSQYHPDRYEQGDPEALRWATDKMQRVNEAYRVLSDPDRRILHDRELRQSQRTDASSQAGRSSGPSSPPRQERTETPKPKESSSNSEVGTLRAFLRKFLPPDQEFERMYVAPKIPLKKLSGAISSYANDVDMDDVLLLVDDTIWGGAGDGILVLENRVIFKELGDTRVAVAIEKLADMRTEENAIYLRARRLIKLNMTAQMEINSVFKLIRDYARLRYTEDALNEQAQGSSSSTSSSTHSAKPDEHGKWRSQIQSARGQSKRFVAEIVEEHPEAEEMLRELVDDFFSDMEAHLYTTGLTEDEPWELHQADQLLANIFELVKTGNSPDHRLFRRRTNEHEYLELLRTALEQIAEAKEAQAGRGQRQDY